MTIEIISSFMNFTMLMCRFYDALILPHLININKLRPENTLNATIPLIKRCKGSFFLYRETINSNRHSSNSSDSFIKISCTL